MSIGGCFSARIMKRVKVRKVHSDEHISEKASRLPEGPCGERTDWGRSIALMAATALRQDNTLVAADQKHFKKLSGL